MCARAQLFPAGHRQVAVRVDIPGESRRGPPGATDREGLPDSLQLLTGEERVALSELLNLLDG